MSTSSRNIHGDVLTDVLGALKLRGEVYCRTLIEGGRGLDLPPGFARFHVLERGACRLHLTNSEESIELGEGDLIVLPTGAGHLLGPIDRAGPMTPMADAMEAGMDPEKLQMTLGSAPFESQLICGKFVLEPVGNVGLSYALPSVIHVPGHAGLPAEPLSHTLRLLALEANARAPGQSLVFGRLVDIILVSAIRFWLSSADGRAESWLAGLRDPHVNRALQLMHGAPGYAWTMEELSRQVGLSRSPLSQRFARLLGRPPMKYLTEWRMTRAARLLEAGAPVSEVSRQVGYQSDAAFSRVFKREVGVPPSRFRRQSGPQDREDAGDPPSG